MIQRIQTVYLLIIVILTGFTLFTPYARLVNLEDDLSYIMKYSGIFLIEDTGAVFKQNVWALTAITALILIIAFITIFLFKKRVLQIRLLFFNLILMIGFYLLLVIYLMQASDKFNAGWYLDIVLVFPFIGIILSILAIQAIGKDEALIKSLNRLR
jgi:hypothetical protein